MGDDHAQRTLEQKALANVRAGLDCRDPDAPVRTVDEAVAHTALVLPWALGIVVLCIAIMAGVSWYERAVPIPKNRADYVANVFRKAEKVANREIARVYGALHGRVQVSFALRPTGAVEDLHISRSSNDSRVDDAALVRVKAGEPYGPFPESAGRELLRVRGTWRFEGSSATFTLDP